MVTAKQLETIKHVKKRNCGCTAAIVKKRSFDSETMMYGISATPASVSFDITRRVFSRSGLWVCCEILVRNICGPTRSVFDDKKSIQIVNTTDKTKFDPITTERIDDFREVSILFVLTTHSEFLYYTEKNVSEIF